MCKTFISWKCKADIKVGIAIILCIFTCSSAYAEDKLDNQGSVAATAAGWKGREEI